VLDSHFAQRDTTPATRVRVVAGALSPADPY
jgi:hypothetical protein